MSRSATLAHVKLLRALGVARRTPGRVPQQVKPILLERAYAREIIALVTSKIRPAFEPLLAELPAIMASAAALKRGDRIDAGEGRRVQVLIDQARAQLASSIKLTDIQQMAERTAAAVNVHNRVQLNRQTRAALGIDVSSLGRDMAPRLDNFVVENVALIRDIPAKTAADVEKTVTQAVNDGTLSKDLAKTLADKFGYSETRSRLIARDQIGKLYGQINATRQKDLGISKFYWITSGDDRVRPEHEELGDGGPYSYDDPPDEGLPGEPILCRCNAEPDFDGLLEGLDGDDATDSDNPPEE